MTVTKVSDQLYRGPKPESWASLAMFCPASVVVNLETGVKEILLGNGNDELLWCLKEKIRFYDFALSSFLPPSPEIVRAILSVLTDFGTPVYLHCRHGKERTGYIVAIYRMQIHNWSFEQAHAEWVAMGCRWPWYVLWKNSLKQWEKK